MDVAAAIKKKKIHKAQSSSLTSSGIFPITRAIPFRIARRDSRRLRNKTKNRINSPAPAAVPDAAPKNSRRVWL